MSEPATAPDEAMRFAENTAWTSASATTVRSSAGLATQNASRTSIVWLA